MGVIKMRKIEQQMNNAVYNKANWSKDNTSVHYNEHTHTSCIRLHGNLIATYKHDGLYKVIPNADMFRDWPTATTRSRLRALGVDASIRNFEATIDGVVL